jgi:hypothetical protein
VNSVAVINWEDQVFKERVAYSLEKTGYVLTEDYQQHGVRIQVWTKACDAPNKGQWIKGSVEEQLRLIPVELLVSRLKERLRMLLPSSTQEQQLEHAATSLAFDLQGRPGSDWPSAPAAGGDT